MCYFNTRQQKEKEEHSVRISSLGIFKATAYCLLSYFIITESLYPTDIFLKCFYFPHHHDVLLVPPFHKRIALIKLNLPLGHNEWTTYTLDKIPHCQNIQRLVLLTWMEEFSMNKSLFNPIMICILITSLILITYPSCLVWSPFINESLLSIICNYI